MESDLSPIIDTLLASRLGHQSLGRLALLNKACNKKWTPHLYNTVRITTPQQRGRFMTAKCLSALAHNCQYITAIQTRYPLTLIPFANKEEVPTLRLHTLDVLTDARAETLTQEEDLAIVGVLERSPELLHLSIRRAPIHPVRILMTIVRYQVALRTLSLFNVTEYDKIPQGTVELAKVFLGRCSSELETLVLALYINGIQINHDPLRHGGPLSIAGEVSTTRKQHPKLKVFTLVGLQDGSELEWHVLKRFLPSCTTLRILDGARTQLSDGTIGWVTDCGDVQDALGQIKGVWPQPLFDWSQGSKPNEDRRVSKTIANILNETGRFRPVWHTITIHHRGDELALTAQSIARVCTHDLVRLNIGGSSQFGSQGMQAIFTSCQDLRQFDSFNDDETINWAYTSYPTMMAQDIVSAPWVCRWLTLLHLEIVGIPRPDVDVYGNGDPFTVRGTKEESHELQRKVYSQLGALSCLEELYLGHRHSADKLSTIMKECLEDDEIEDEDEDDDMVSEDEDTVGTDDFLTDCLEFSLESGLHLLAGLKELRILDVTFTCHRIGVPELEWMENNFPNLASLRGLDPVRSMEDHVECKSILKKLGFFGPEALTWARTHKIEWLPKEDQTDLEWRWSADQDENMDADESEEDKRQEAEDKRQEAEDRQAWEEEIMRKHYEFERALHSL